MLLSPNSTSCCFNSCCFDCLKSYLTSSHKLANRRAGVCPMSNCSEQDIFVEELIPNHALNKAAEWFNRQKVSKMESEDIEVDKPKSKDDDITEVARQLLCDATEEANKKTSDKNA